MTEQRNVKIGDNSLGAQELKKLVESIESLEDQKAGVQSDIKGVYENAKSQGFDIKILRRVIQRRKKSRAEIDEEDSQIQVYEGSIFD